MRPDCYSGTVAALSEVTGDVVWSWSASGPNEGLGIWSPISLTPDGNIVFGTGNACGTEKYAQAIVALNGTSGAYAWIAPSTGPGLIAMSAAAFRNGVMMASSRARMDFSTP